jgi:hypothetical protein
MWLPGIEGDHPITPVRTTFDTRSGLVRAQLDKVDYGYVDKPVRYQGRIYQPKSELHITVVGQDAEMLRKHLESHPRHADDIDDLVLSANWACNKLDEFYHVVQAPGVENIIQMVEMPGLRQFYRDLSRLVGQGFLVPPIHVTLYMLGADREIRLPNQQSFRDLVQTRIQPNEVAVEGEDSGPRRGTTRPLGR